MDKKTVKADKTYKPYQVKLTDRVLTELKGIYRDTGGNLSLACSQVGITRDAYYKHIKVHPEYATEMSKMKGVRDSLAERNITKAIKENDVPTTRWYLEKTNEAYNPKLVVESKGIIMNLNKDISDMDNEELLNLISTD